MKTIISQLGLQPKHVPFQWFLEMSVVDVGKAFHTRGPAKMVVCVTVIQILSARVEAENVSSHSGQRPVQSRYVYFVEV